MRINPLAISKGPEKKTGKKAPMGRTSQPQSPNHTSPVNPSYCNNKYQTLLDQHPPTCLLPKHTTDNAANLLPPNPKIVKEAKKLALEAKINQLLKPDYLAVKKQKSPKSATSGRGAEKPPKKKSTKSPKEKKNGEKTNEGAKMKIKKILKIKKEKPKKPKIQLSANYNKNHRVHRMASLNALAKVHILYENDSRGSPSDGSEPENGVSEIIRKVSLSEDLICPSLTTTNVASAFVPLKTVIKSEAVPKVKKSKKDSGILDSVKIKTKAEKNKCDKKRESKKDKASTTIKKADKKLASKKPTAAADLPAKKCRKRKAVCDVEIIDTKLCKRVACLNAQAILAASCTPERNRRTTEKKVCKMDEITINEKEIMTYNHEIVTDQSITTQVTNHQTCTTFIRQKPSALAKQTSSSSTSIHHNVVHASGRVVDGRADPKSVLSSTASKSSDKVHTLSTTSESSGDVQTTVSNVGLTAEYTEVTKVHINTTKAMQLKEEGSKAKRTTIERILEKDDVAITRMYRYQTKGTSQSYCVKMHTTYKPSANKPFSGTPPPAVTQGKPSSVVEDNSPAPEIISTVVHGDPGYYNYNPHSVASPQNYSMNHSSVARVNGVPVVSVSPIVRQFSSAFTVPHYGATSPSHQTPVSYPQGDYNKQGYYPPPAHDPCLIHKPIPYHPPQSPPHQTHSHSPIGQSIPPPISPHHHQPLPAHHQSPSHPINHPTHPPPAHSSYPQDPCLSVHNLTSRGSPYQNDVSQHGYPMSRMSPHISHSSYQPPDSIAPLPAHHHHHHQQHLHQHHQRSPIRPPSYPAPLSPNHSSPSLSPAPVYHCSSGPYPQRQQHVYSQQMPSHNYTHPEYSSAPTYAVLSPVPMGLQKGNQRISGHQLTVSPSIMHSGSRSSRNSPATAPKAEPTMPTEINSSSFPPVFSTSNNDYSNYPQPAYPTDVNARSKMNKSTVAPVYKNNMSVTIPSSKICHQSSDCYIVHETSSREIRNQGCGVWNLQTHRNNNNDNHGGTSLIAGNAKSAKATCHWSRVQNVEVVASTKPPNHRRLRAATVAATNSSLNAQRQHQQIQQFQLQQPQLVLEKVSEAAPIVQQQHTSSQVLSSTSSKKKVCVSSSRLNTSSRHKSPPEEIDLTESTENVQITVLKKTDTATVSTMNVVKKVKQRSSSERQTVVDVQQQQPQLPQTQQQRLDGKQSKKPGDVVVVPHPLALIPKKKGPKKFSNGWSWEGEPFDKMVFISNDDPPTLRKCYPAMRHIEGDIINIRDCILLKSGPRKIDLPFVAKVCALWESLEDGEMMVSLLWYYRPEHTDQGRRPIDLEDEIFASKHRDVNSVACIEDKCYVLTFAEYCRYRGRMRMFEDNYQLSSPVVPQPDEGYSRKARLPPGRVSPEMVFVCRKVYEFRQKRILKNPV